MVDYWRSHGVGQLTRWWGEVLSLGVRWPRVREQKKRRMTVAMLWKCIPLRHPRLPYCFCPLAMDVRTITDFDMY